MTGPSLRATYRLQLHGGTGLAGARALVPYLDRLGVSHLYTSPVLRARRASAHGYDVVDPTALHPELGGEADRRALAGELAAHRMGWILDLVPNHMGAGPENARWEDVLAGGSGSPYARWFDIEWPEPPTSARRRLLIPVLADFRARALARGEIALALEAGRLRVRYFDQSFPLDPATVLRILDGGRRGLAPPGPPGRDRTEDPDRRELEEIMAIFRALPRRSAAHPAALEARRRTASEAIERLAALCGRSAAVRDRVEAAVREFSAGPGGPMRLRALLDAQPYRLASWRAATREVSYRRFFDVNDVVAVRMEDPEIFAESHALVFEWLRAGELAGLRIDHIDGLLDPLGYLERLAAHSPVIYVEKILSEDERLRPEWPVSGTTGYEFMGQVDAIFIHPDGFREVEARYRRAVSRQPGFDFRRAAERGRWTVLRDLLAADVRRLARLLQPIAARDPRTARSGRGRLVGAIAEVIAAFPVYRTYVSGRTAHVAGPDRAYLETALAAARKRGRADPASLELLGEVLLLERLGERPLADARERIEFVERFQQATGPVAAKGIEDTAHYIYVPLLTLNEVGGAPDIPLGDAVARLHRMNGERAARWPETLLATTTHDTKRSADVRARLAVLTEAPDLWSSCVARWQRWNGRHRRLVRGRFAPDANTEILLYQTLAGMWPLPGPGRAAGGIPPAAELGETRERIEAFMLKAAREAKVRTSWIRPDHEFEAALAGFVRALLTADTGHPPPRFIADLEHLVERIARPGLWNALARTLIHLTAPGVPDLYQGDELWNFALVDPDNRRPVDFAERAALLGELGRRQAEAEAEAGGAPGGVAALARELAGTVEDGRLKLYVIWRALEARRRDPALFAGGAYEPLRAAGRAAAHVFAFARRDRDRGRAAITVVPRLAATLVGDPRAPPVGPRIWSGTRLALPSWLRGARFDCELTGARVTAEDGAEGPELPVDQVLGILPVALLSAGAGAGAGAGSLPGPGGP